jgi:hypothetical protein
MAIIGAHALLYTSEPEAVRAILRDAFGFAHVDAGDGWLIFALPPAEIAVHPGSGDFAQVHADRRLAGVVLYLMCDDLSGMMRTLEARNVACGPVTRAEWGISTTVRLPSGLEIGLYQPLHETAIGKAQ